MIELEKVFNDFFTPKSFGFTKKSNDWMNEMCNEISESINAGYIHNERYSVENERLTIDIVVPGLTKDDVKVIVNKKEMTVTISTTFKEKEEGDFWFVYPFEKTYKLPEGIDFGSFKKTCENGVLTVTAEIKAEEEEREYLLTI